MVFWPPPPDQEERKEKAMNNGCDCLVQAAGISPIITASGCALYKYTAGSTPARKE
jgi:hypothetical protein